MVLLKIKRKGEPKKTDALEVIERLPKDQFGISPAAATQIQKLTTNTDHRYLRVAIRGGGCSGLSLHYEMVNEIMGFDLVFSAYGAQVVIDKKSLTVLGGATLHCRDYLGAKEFFLINNPAEKQCSCGQSFSL